jgi:hypothetical protein
MSLIHYYATRRAGCAQAIIEGRLQTESEAASWESLGLDETPNSKVLLVCREIIKQHGFMAVRAFHEGKGALGRMVCAEVNRDIT